MRMRRPWLLLSIALAVAACTSTAPPRRMGGSASPEVSPEPSAADAEASPGASPQTAQRPDRLVAVNAEHQLVVVDAETGQTLTVLHQGDEPDDFGGAGEEPFAAGAFLDSVAVEQAGGVVWFPTCCEPAPGALHTVPIAGGEPKTVGVGYDPALHPAQDRVAVVEMQWLTIMDFSGKATHRFEPAAEPPMEIAQPSWSPDGRTLVFEAMVDNRGEPEIHLLAADAVSMDEARRVPATSARAPWRSPVFDASGALWVLEQSVTTPAGEHTTARLRVDTATGAVLQRREVHVAIKRQSYDRGGAHLLLVLSGGDLIWESGEITRRLPGSFISAAW